MVNLQDIKLKVVKDRGENPIEYDLWPDQERQLTRRPAVQEAAEELEGQMSPAEVRETIQGILTEHNIDSSSVVVMPQAGRNSIDVDIVEDRGSEIATIAKRDNLG